MSQEKTVDKLFSFDFIVVPDLFSPRCLRMK